MGVSIVMKNSLQLSAFPCIPSWLALSLTFSAYYMSTSLAWYCALGSQQSVGHMLVELVCVNSSLQGMMN